MEKVGLTGDKITSEKGGSYPDESNKSISDGWWAGYRPWEMPLEAMLNHMTQQRALLHVFSNVLPSGTLSSEDSRNGLDSYRFRVHFRIPKAPGPSVEKPE